MEGKKDFNYTYDSQGLPWKAPELLEQNCNGFNTKTDIYRLYFFLIWLVYYENIDDFFSNLAYTV
jgi:hypothetical protein